MLVVGVTYKPNVADVRESSALEIIRELREAGAHVEYTDPLVDTVESPLGRLTCMREPEKASWDVVLVHTRHADVRLDWLRGFRVLDTTRHR